MHDAHSALPGSGRGLSTEQFIALNDELRAMIQAGVPLDTGLRGTATRSEGGLKSLCERLATRVGAGQSLQEALAAEGARLPPLYHAALQAGMKSGRLSEVLASLSDLTMRVASLRRRLHLSLVYPLIVFLLAYALFTLFLWYVVPQIERTTELFRLPQSAVLRLLQGLHDTLPFWGWEIPAVLLGLPLLSWLVRVLWGVNPIVAVHRWVVSALASMASVVSPATARRLHESWGDGALTGLRAARRAQYANLLAMLIDAEVPLPEALRLAGDACEDRELQSASQQVARQVEQGQSLTAALKESPGFPSLMSWMMGVGQAQSSLGASLTQLATVYEQRAQLRMDWIRRLVPPLVVTLFGGSITLIYGLALFLPLTELLRNLALP